MRTRISDVPLLPDAHTHVLYVQEKLRKEREELMQSAAAFKAEQDRLLQETERLRKEQVCDPRNWWCGMKG